MPFIACVDDQTVIPADVDDGETVFCTSCGERMRTRGPFDDGRARHFYHIDDLSGTCPRTDATGDPGPAESATHEKLKALAVAGLRERFDTYQRCSPEIAVDVSETETAVEQRRADALLEFSERNRFFGEGVIVEVQHLNAGKDIRATTHDYLSQDYSVYWATVDEFADDRFLVEEMEAAFNTNADAAFSPYRCAPPAVDAPERLIAPDNNAPYTTTDPVPSCPHELVPGGDGIRVCVRCGLELDICIYDAGRGFLCPVDRFDRRVSGERVLAADQESVEFPVPIRPVEEHGEPPDHTHQWQGPIEVFGGKKYRCWKCESILVDAGDEISIVHEPSAPSWQPETPPWE